MNNTIELVLIAIGLCMDTLAVSIAAGCFMKPYKISLLLRFAIILSICQAVMPFFGWLAGETIIEYIKDYDHWIASVLLAFIGGKMFIEGCHLKSCDQEKTNSFNPNSLWVTMTLAVATSIDALAVGFSYSALGRNIGSLIIACAITTFLFAIGGLFLGHRFGAKHKNIAEILGGVILIIIGIKIVIEHCCL
ncbi:MAG: manganese efflux pump MntP family protein [Bacteroidales bacterium]|nr:manganese efflux pump MntP family protein [Bacteroidales bacterium]